MAEIQEFISALLWAQFEKDHLKSFHFLFVLRKTAKIPHFRFNFYVILIKKGLQSFLSLVSYVLFQTLILLLYNLFESNRKSLFVRPNSLSIEKLQRRKLCLFMNTIQNHLIDINSLSLFQIFFDSHIQSPGTLTLANVDPSVLDVRFHSLVQCTHIGLDQSG